MATSWWVISPPGSSSGSVISPTLPAGTKVVSTPSSGKQYDMFVSSGQSGIPSGIYKRWIVNGGPFPTEAAARKDLVTGPPTVIPGLSGLTGLAAIGDFFSRLSNPNTWARVGEVAIGGLLLGIGVYALVSNTETGKAAKSGIKKVASTAAMIK
jgi:hypothetical protein